MTPRVSVVIPVYNDASFLEAAIESVLAQDHEALELIVVDDGSDDGSGEVAARYGDRLRLLRQENAGQSAALAAGWERAGGELIGYLSADDLLRRQAVRQVAAALAAHPAAVLAYPDFGMIDIEGKLTRVVTTPEFSRRELYAQLRCQPGPGALFRKTAYLSAGPWRRDLRQVPDLEFFLRLALEGEFVRVPEVLADFRKHAGSTTYSAVPPERCDEPLRMVSRLLERPGLAPDILGWRREMQASARYLAAILHGQSGRRGRALQQLAHAVAGDPASLFSRRALAAVSHLLASGGLSPGG